MSARAVIALLGNPAALVIIKATVVLTLACAAGAVARELSAARRHLLWLGALCSCVLLLLFSPVVPSIVIHAPILAQGVAATTGRSAGLAHATPSSTTTAGEPLRTRQFENTQGDQRVRRRPIPSPGHPLGVLWIIGCVALLGRHAMGLVAAARLARRACIATDHETLRELASAAAVAGVRRTIRLGYSGQVQSPVTLGVARPLVLLPNEARCWSIDCRRAVLLHEVAHIARADWLSQIVGRLARDVFWPHPLAWRAFAHLRDDAERAADDCVLGSGMPAWEYAAHVLAVAQRTRRRPSLAAVGMALTNDLERRFIAMFDAGRSRTIVTSRTRVAAAGVALALVSPFASLRVAAGAPLAAARRASPFDLTVAATTTRSEGNPSPAREATLAQSADVHPMRLIATTVEGAPPIVVVGDSAHRETGIVRPNFSGRWRQDTVAGPSVNSYVTDSTIIAQSGKTISIDSHGHFLYEPTRNRFDAIPIGGAGIQGFTATGNDTASVVASALWYGDTLVVDYHDNGSTTGGRYVHTIERLSLSADGNTLFADNLSYAGGRYRWGGPHTFVLRRILP